MAFNTSLEMVGKIAKIMIAGELDASVAVEFKHKIEEAAQQDAKRLVLIAGGLEYMSSAGLRILVFAKQKMPNDVDIFLVGAQPQIIEPITQTGLHHSLTILESYDADVIETL
jgi:anti-anti-sigma factor